MEKLTIGEMRTVLEGLPEDLVVEFSAGNEPADCERILEYAKRLQTKQEEGET